MNKNTFTVVLLILILAGFWATSDRPSHLASNSIENFPIYTQPDEISCGPTCCAMLIKYYKQRDVNIEDLKKEAYTSWFHYKGKEFGMTIPSFLEKTLCESGIPAKLIKGNLDLAKACVDQDRPPVVLLRSSEKTWHYVVVVGYTENEITLADPGGERRTISTENFMASWLFLKTINGDDPTTPCFLCKEGQIGGIRNIFAKCDYCGGSGQIDYYLKLINLTEVSVCTMIVPKYPRSK